MRRLRFFPIIFILGLGIIFALVGNIWLRQAFATWELYFAPPTQLRVIQRETGGYTLQDPLDPPTTFTYDINPAIRELYLVMRTRQETNFGPGGCRMTGGFDGKKKEYDYELTFLRNDAILLEAYLVPACVRWTLTKNDAWYLHHFTNAETYSPGTYLSDTTLRDAFRAATALPYSPLTGR